MSNPGLPSRRRFTRSVLFGLSALCVDQRSVLRRGLQIATAPWPGGGCAPTEPMEIGPFHRDGAPALTALCDATEAGRHISVTGRVMSEGECRPLANVLLDVWQANAAGRYDVQDKSHEITPADYHLRARLESGGDGVFGFSSVLPGNYGPPNALRAKHVHYLIQRSGYESLITQMYFEGDPWTERDPLVRRTLIRPLSDAGEVRFDIVLRRERPVDHATLRTMGDYVGEYTAPELHGDTIHVAWRYGRLFAIYGRDDVAELRPDSATRLFAREWDARLTFVRDEHGTVAEMHGDLDDGRKVRLEKVR